jgi:beta-phosphoglucomutase-like phosphatase (HAD superfamily)
MGLEAIIFDVDGVLAETHEARRSAFNSVFRDAGLDWNWDRALYATLPHCGGSREIILAFVERRLPRWRLTEDEMQLVAVMGRRHATIYRDLLDTNAVLLRPGVVKFLHTAARQGVRLAIATDESRAEVTALLRANLGPKGAGVFEAVCAPDGPAGGQATNRHAEALENVQPSACLALGSPQAGLKSAARLGIRTVETRGLYAEFEDCGAAPSASSLSRGNILSTIVPRSAFADPDALLEELRCLHSAGASTISRNVESGRMPWAQPAPEASHARYRHLEG